MGDEGGDEGGHTERGEEEDGDHGEDLHEAEVTGADLWWQVAGLGVRDQHLGAEGKNSYLLPTGSEERGILRVGSVHVAIIPSCQDMKTIALYCINMNIVG